MSDGLLLATQPGLCLHLAASQVEANIWSRERGGGALLGPGLQQECNHVILGGGESVAALKHITFYKVKIKY